MKNIFASIILCILLTNVYAQNSSSISGKVIDKETKEAMPFTTIQIKSPSSDKTNIGTITGENGRFSIIDLKKGKYRVCISYLGYNEKDIPIFIGDLNKSYDLGTVEMTSADNRIGEVTVNGKKSLTSSALDKKVFDISNNISQSGGSVLEAMRNLPGLTVDQEGKVYLRGSDKVTVLIDGKQSSLTGFGNQKGLDNVSANNIERIEIINNPSAKYDAKGMAGIINIIYKKNNKNGFNGDIAFNYGMGEFNERKKNLPNIMDKYSYTPKYNPSLSLNYRTDKFNFFIQSEGMFRKKVNSNEFSTRTFSENGKKGEISQFLENRTQQLYNIKGGFDIYFNSNNTLTVYGLFEDEFHIDRGHVPYDYVDGKRKRFWTWAEDERTFHMNYNANYKHLFAQPGHYIETTAHYSKGNEDELFPFTDTSDLRNSTDSTHLIDKEEIIAFDIDYVKPLRSGRIEMGGKTQLRNIPISYKIFPGEGSVLDKNLGKWSKYCENIYSAYLNYIFESRHIDIEAGLRAEESDINYKIDPLNNYYRDNESYTKFDLFPNVRFTYKIDDNNKLSLFYNRRVDRPGEFELRPFPKYDDPEILKTGNPYLRPEYTQSFETAYKTIWDGGSFFVSAYYKHINDIFTRIYVNDLTDNSLLNGITQNLGNGQNWGTEIIVEQNISKSISANASFNWYKNIIGEFSGEVIYPQKQSYNSPRSSSNTWNLKVNGNAKLASNFNIQCSYIYYAPDIVPQGKIKSRSSLDFGINKKMFDNKLELMLSATDILNDFGIRKTVEGNGFSMTSENYYETQVVMVGAKFKF